MREDIEFFHVTPPKDSEFKFTCVVGVGRSDQSLWIQVAVPDQKAFDWLADLQEQAGAVVLQDGAGRIFVEVRAVIAACRDPEKQGELIAGAAAWVENLHPNNFRNGPVALYAKRDSGH
jgi:hypothetical protein